MTTIILLIALAAAIGLIVQLFRTLAEADRLIDAQRQRIAILEQREHTLTVAIEQGQARIGLLVGYNTHLEDRNARLVRTINHYIVALPSASKPQQLEGLRERLAARSMN